MSELATDHQLLPRIETDLGRPDILSPEALSFLGDLSRRFGARIDQLLAARVERRAGGAALDFLPETQGIRDGEWAVAPVPRDLMKRHVEITGPVDRKMIINALNSGANVFMADFEDANSPTWANCVEGQANLYDAVRGTIDYVNSETGKQYRLGPKPATLMVRPRGLHLVERHVRVAGDPMRAALFDFGLFLFHNARALLDRGTGPYFYLAKLEHFLEARLWNDVFGYAESALGLPTASIKATVLVETLPAAFQMDEILYELRERSAGLNCGRWDYIFSFIKTQRDDPAAVLPDRSQVTMRQPCMRAYTQLAIRTCHRRGAHAMGGMAAQIPIKNDRAANARALDKVRADKLREVADGHDGTWVAHPALVPVAREVFETHVRGPHQLDRLREDVDVTAEDLLQVPIGTRSEEGLRLNIRVGIQYLEAWLGGSGAVPLYHLMEDAATAEISRAQIWQWIRHRATLEDGRVVTPDLLSRITTEEMKHIAQEVGPARMQSGRFDDARSLFARLSAAPALEEFLTIPAYALLTD